jgi:hypothetical protein
MYNTQVHYGTSTIRPTVVAETENRINSRSSVIGGGCDYRACQNPETSFAATMGRSMQSLAVTVAAAFQCRSLSRLLKLSFTYKL